ncbi:hypothetical protein [Kutzneria albida]|uniref:Uncharacterized protein n=1 Tax=Kutzneria albida DSM 43870 TaxID=1449976 RepID=W5WBP5_9PSEU|nr:hypothetical protein [Kutzneria albida]AHH98302.1 hypothetical protein KALB_4940 [Kutzneria albida DSM 43870]
MIPHDDVNPELLAVQTRREWTTPPWPVGSDQLLETTMAARHVWRQTLPEAPSPVESPFVVGSPESTVGGLEDHLAQRINALPNPLRALAAALTEFADQLDEHGVVPVAVNLTTGHEKQYTSIEHDRYTRPAEVHVSIRGVQRSWLNTHTKETP